MPRPSQRSSKPVFQSVMDLGLRDVGVRNEPRRLAAYVGKASLGVFALVVLSVVAVCVIVVATGAGPWAFVVFAVLLPVAVLALGVRRSKRSPVIVVKVTAEGVNRATWLFFVPYLLLVPAAVVAGEALVLIPVVVLVAIMIALFLRNRGRVPEMLRGLRSVLGGDERVLGDGIGLAQGMRSGPKALRLAIATDRRVLVARSPRSEEPFLLVDVPYPRVSRFGIEWKQWGRAGELSLTVEEEGGAPPQTHVITSMLPANLLSIAKALQSHGVDADDPGAVSDAARGWEQALRPPPPEPLLDRDAMSTRQFDWGLWLLLGLGAVGFWFNPLGPWIDPIVVILLTAAVVGVVAGYVSGTRSSLAYLVPLNLLIVPTFLLADPVGVILLMVVVSLVAAIGLWAGSALRRARAARPGAPTGAARRPAAGGGLRNAISGRRLIRISGVLVAVIAGLAVVASAAGFDPATLRMVVDEAFANQERVDGRSNLTGNDASLTYTPGPDLREFIVDEDWDAGPNDGARWELRSSFTKGYNVVSLSHYIFDDPHLDNPAAVRDFVAGKDREHTRIAGKRVGHTERVVDGRKGYVWTHRNRRDYWHYAVWFPQPVHTIRVECIAKKQESRFRRLCAEALRTLEFH